MRKPAKPTASGSRAARVAAFDSGSAGSYPRRRRVSASLSSVIGVPRRCQEHLESTPSGKLLVSEVPPPLDIHQRPKRLLKMRPQVHKVVVRCGLEQVRGTAPRE